MDKKELFQTTVEAIAKTIISLSFQKAFDFAFKLANSASYSLTFHYSDAVFVDISNWMSKNRQYLKFVSTEKVESLQKVTQWDFSGTGEQDHWMITPGYGSYVLKHPDFPPFLVSRTESKDDKTKALAFPADTITLTCPANQRAKLQQFVQMIYDSRDLYKEKDDSSWIKIFQNNEWFQRVMKTQNHVREDLLPPDLLRVEQIVKEFLESKDEYRKKNLRWKLGIMLHSVPGCGKSHFIAYLAHKYKLDIHYLDFSNLIAPIKTLAKVSERSIVLLEDLDLMKMGKRVFEEIIEDGEDDNDDSDKDKNLVKEPEKKVSAFMADFLNALDGVFVNEGMIVIATTNSLKDIDDAILRPGRMDHVIEIKELPPDVILKYWLNFFEIPEEKHHLYKGTKGFVVSQSQKILKDNMNNAEKAREELGIAKAERNC